MADACLCTAHDAAGCAGGGLSPAADGGCSCACHGGEDATNQTEPECTGETARWCPRHGDCTCPAREDWPDEFTFDGDDCPLHGRHSTHADDATESPEEVLLRERDEARAERDALRAIIEGRPTPPTPAEIAAHPGPWLVQYGDDTYYVLLKPSALVGAKAPVGHSLRPARWWPLGDRRPCAWPVVEASRG